MWNETASTSARFQKHCLRAVSMVHVPVEDGDPLDAAAARQLRGERGVREEAVAVGPVGLGVVARRAHERIGPVAVAVENRGRRIERGAGGGERRVP